MSHVSQRLLALEIRNVRREATEAGAPNGFSADQILEETIRFLELPRPQQRATLPDWTDAELDYMAARLPLIRRARFDPGRDRR